MNFSSIAREVASVIQSGCNFPVLTEFPHSAVQRNSFYCIVSIKNVSFDFKNKLCGSDLAVPMDFKISLSLYAPENTDFLRFSNIFDDNIIQTVMDSNLNISEININSAEMYKPFKQLRISADINVSGITEVEKFDS